VLAAFLDGERVPDRPNASGTLTKLRSDTTLEQVARAAYEGVLAGLVRGLTTLTDSAYLRLAASPSPAAAPDRLPIVSCSPTEITHKKIYLADHLRDP
jgi:hypothetical protein